MTMLLVELKTRARIQLNGARRQPASAGSPDAGGELRLRHCLNQAARDVGFAHWDHARRVLGGDAQRGEDMGSFWYAPACSTMLSQWFADYAQARAALSAGRHGFLLPYRRQFMVVQDEFLRELGLDPRDPAWWEARDLVAAYGTRSWLEVANKRLKAPLSTFQR